MIKKLIHRLRNAVWLLTDTKHKKLTSPQMIDAVASVHSRHLDLMSEIQLGDLWDDNKRTDMEVRIAVLRGKLRYMPESLAMVEQILDNYKNSDAHSEKLKYFTRTFPMVHPAGEVSVSARKELIHNDQVGSKRLFTVWSPITHYQYAPLSGFPRYGFITKVCPQFFHLFFEKKLVESLDVQMGESVMWGGGYTHAGNPNTSKTLSAALVIRMTEEPVMYEPCRLISDGITDKDKQKRPSDEMEAKDQIEFCLDLLKAAELSSADNSLEDIFREAHEFLHKRITAPNNALGFCLSVLAQRMKKNTNPDFLHAASLLIAFEYLYGVKYFRDKFPNMTSPEFREILKKYDYLKIIPFKSYQLAKLLDEDPSEDVESFCF